MKYLKYIFGVLSGVCLLISLCLLSLSAFESYIWKDYLTSPDLIGLALIFDMWFLVFGIASIQIKSRKTN